MSSTYRLQLALLGTNFVYRKQTVKFHHSDHYSEHYCEHFDTTQFKPKEEYASPDHFAFYSGVSQE